MSRRFFRKFMVKPEVVLNNRFLRRIAPGLADPSVWRLNRRAAAAAMAIGLFWCMIPMPLQMAPAAVFAVYFRANIAISLALVWLTNPLTCGPVWYVSYRVGRWVLGQPPVEFASDWATTVQQVLQCWQPLFVGSILIGATLSIVGYVGTHVSWRAMVRSARRRRLVAFETRKLALQAIPVEQGPQRS